MSPLLALLSMDLLWRNALGAIPLAIAVGIICRYAKCRPSTRHALWLIVLLSLLAPPLLPSLDFSDDVGAPQFFAAIAKDAKQNRELDKPPAIASAPENDPLPERLQGTAQPIATSPIKPPSSSETSTSNNPMPESAASTASERSPTVLRRPASHPPSSGPPVLEREPAAPIAQTSGARQDVSANPPARATLPSPREPMEDADESAAADRGATSPTQPVFPSFGWMESVNRPNIAASAAARSPALATPSAAIAPTAAAEPSTFSTLAAAVEWRDWLYRVAAVRDSIVTLAPIPNTLWAFGVMAIILVMLVRVWRFNRVLRRATDADREVVDLVRDCADAIGLRSMPRVLMTDRSVSPLVWCGVNRVLLLPGSLWQELDDSGRRAVLLHELAHLKRRDHWVCWVEMIACTVYWWNPLAWWVRHRLRDEADYCCDAWVTAVLPESRTAYARALLATKQFLNSTPSRVEAPSMALGATSARTKRFARRLTMVMTERSTPRLSITGSAAALMLAGAAWLATPLWACPPEESSGGPNAQAIAQQAQKEAKAAAEKAMKAEKTARAKAQAQSGGKVKVPVHVVEGMPAEAKAELEAALALAHDQHGNEHVAAALAMAHDAHTKAMAEAHAAEGHAAPDAAASTFEAHMAARGEDHGEGHAVIAQAAPRARGGQVSRSAAPAGGGDLEGRIDRLEERLDRLTAHLEQLLGGGGGAGATAGPRGGLYTTTPAPPPPPAPAAPPAAPAQPRRPGAVAAPAAPAPPVAPNTGAFRRAPGAALGGGMARATPAPDAFADTDETIIKFYPLPGDMGPALFEFMRRDDVKVFVASRDDGIEVHGTPQQHRIFAAFVKMIYPEAQIDAMLPPGATPRAAVAPPELAAPRGEMRIAEARRAEVENRLREAREQINRQRSGATDQMRRQMEQSCKQAEQQRKQMEQQRKGLERQVEELMKKSSDLQRKAEELREKAEGLGDESQQQQLMAQAEAMDAQAEQMEAQAEAHEEQIEAQLEALEEQLEAQMEAMEDQLAAQEEALESQLEAQEEALEAELEAQMAAIEAEMENLPPPSEPSAPGAPAAPDAPTAPSSPR